jgi:NAD(P)-dependent dehydrogenase (short-subunit alcohol dehydrogenase family)
VSDPLFDLSGRVAVITGGMGQLGAEYAAALAERGMRVAVVDLETEPKQGAADLSSGLAEGSIRAWQVDVTDREAVGRVADEIAAAWDVPHLLVNNAALDSPPDAPAAEVGPFETYP